ncbi:VOC family protein [Motilibacter aurantiacus]|uniref:VOC family protein n=1 Tax=Motilibacter aurantiacus TaxID=2714955 RepID=UPI00140CE143|nr:VOC family protein [Motilibacter aurantiacus]NHC46004.1 glyoxalase [Motilibacter aurantiacus]
MTMIFINLPVADVRASDAFWQALGYGRNEQFCDDQATNVVLDDNITLMLLQQARFSDFLPAGTPVAGPHAGTRALYALSADSREAVDTLVDKALAAGGSDWMPAQDHGFTYGRSFRDLDGHVFEVMWMNPAVAAGEAEVPELAAAGS